MQEKFTVHWTSALAGMRGHLSFDTKHKALAEARLLFVEGAKNIRVSHLVNGDAKAINWRKP